MGLYFQNAGVTIGETRLFAYQASIDNKTELQRVDSLGYVSPIDAAITRRPMGTFSAEFYWPSANLFSTFGLEIFGASSIIDGNIGGVAFTNGYITELSLSVEAMSIVRGSIKGEFVGRMGALGTNPTDSSPTSLFDGNNSTISSIDEAISAEISLTRNITPIFKLGVIESSTLADIVLGWEYGGGEIRCSANGIGLQKVIETCKGSNSFAITPKGSCGSTATAITFGDMTITNSSISINKSEDLVGSIELVKYI